jgi:hypothetical protein
LFWGFSLAFYFLSMDRRQRGQIFVYVGPCKQLHSIDVSGLRGVSQVVVYAELGHHTENCSSDSTDIKAAIMGTMELEAMTSMAARRESLVRILKDYEEVVVR